jgi:hypothetical protein
VLTLCVEASGTLTPWLVAWESLSDPVADRRLAEIVARRGPPCAGYIVKADPEGNEFCLD